MPRQTIRRPAFSLVELVMVVVIIGVIASIAVPRLAQAARRAEINALRADVANVRRSIDHFYAEHGRYPGFDPGTGSPDDDYFKQQLLWRSDEAGEVSEQFQAGFFLGPYLREPFPVNPFNGLDTVKVRLNAAEGMPSTDSYGWVATLSDGDFVLSVADTTIEDLATTVMDAKAVDETKTGLKGK